MDASAVERSRVGCWWTRRMGIRGNHYLSVYDPRQPVERGGHHHDSPGIGHGIYCCRWHCDLH